MNKPIMLILILAAFAILAFVGVYAFRSYRVSYPPASSDSEEMLEEEISEDEGEEATGPEASGPEGKNDDDAMAGEEGTMMEGELMLEEDLTPGL